MKREGRLVGISDKPLYVFKLDEENEHWIRYKIDKYEYRLIGPRGYYTFRHPILSKHQKHYSFCEDKLYRFVSGKVLTFDPSPEKATEIAIATVWAELDKLSDRLNRLESLRNMFVPIDNFSCEDGE